LDVTSDVQLFFHVLLGALLFEQPRVFENGGGFKRQRLEDLPISGGKVGRRQARIHVEHAHRVVQRRGHGLLHRSGSNLDQRHADHAAQFQIGHRHFGTKSVGAQRVERHRKQIAPGAQRSIDQGSRDTQV